MVFSRHLREDRVHIGAQVLFRRHDGHAAGRQDRDAIHEEAVLGEDALVARTHIGMGDQRQEFIGARTADEPVRIEPVAGRDRLAQTRGGTVRIELEMVEGPDRLGRLRRGAERGLVRGELMDLRNPCGLALAGHIGLDLHHAGTGLGTGGHRHFLAIVTGDTL